MNAPTTHHLSVALLVALLAAFAPPAARGAAHASRRPAAAAKSEADTLRDEAIRALHAGHRDKAVAALEQAAAFYAKAPDTRLQEVDVLARVGSIHYCQGDMAAAVRSYRRAVDRTRDTGDPILDWYHAIFLGYLGRALLGQRDLPGAEKALRDGLKALDAARFGEAGRWMRAGSDEGNRQFVREGDGAYATLQRVLVAENRPEIALVVAEEGRARAFEELLARRRGADADADGEEDDYESVFHSAPHRSPVAPVTLQDLRHIAHREKATVVEYSVVDYMSGPTNGPECDRTQTAALYAWVISPSGDVAFRTLDLGLLKQVKTGSLRELVEQLRKSIAVRGPGRPSGQVDHAAGKDSLRQLHRLLIEPISELLPKTPEVHVVFVPQGALFYVPFAALVDANDRSVIDLHTVRIAPSIQSLDFIHQPRHASEGKDALVVGNPQPLSKGLPPLDGAEEEALAVAKQLKTTALVEREASISTVLPRLVDARTIHLATHAETDEFSGSSSGVFLAPAVVDQFTVRTGAGETFYSGTSGPVASGFLSAGEIIDLQLSADLVVLSACHTGEGEITGDGVNGLARSFMAAGVPSVVVSLWSVPDAPTQSLMSAFYQHLEDGGDKATALRQAMLATRKEHPSTREWAGFTLVGAATRR